MRKSLLIIAGLCVGFLATSTAHAQVEIFGGYSYLRPPVNVQSSIAITCPIGPPCVPGTTETHPNLNGWEAAGTFNAFKLLGVTADFSGNYGTIQGLPLHVQTYLFGPQLIFRDPFLLSFTSWLAGRMKRKGLLRQQSLPRRMRLQPLSAGVSISRPCRSSLFD